MADVRATLTASSATTQQGGGRSRARFAVNGQTPGPAIAAHRGDLVEVTLRNADVAAGVLPSVFRVNTPQALLLAVYDNLGKGASGAAVQNMDLMLGL